MFLAEYNSPLLCRCFVLQFNGGINLLELAQGDLVMEGGGTKQGAPGHLENTGLKLLDVLPVAPVPIIFLHYDSHP